MGPDSFSTAQVVQALAASKEIQFGLSQEQHFIPRAGLARRLAELLQSLRALETREGMRSSAVSPAAVVRELRERHPSLGSQQQDAEEVLLIFLTALFSPDQRYRPGAAAFSGDNPQGLAAVAELAEMTCCSKLRMRITVPPPFPDPLITNFILPAACRRPEGSCTVGNGGFGGWGGGSLVHHSGESRSLLVGTAPGASLSADGSGAPDLAAERSPAAGLVSSGLSCAACGGHHEVKVDLFTDLSVPIARSPRARGAGALGALSIEDCLEAWAAPEAVEGARCENCLLAKARATLQARREHLAPLLATLPAERREQLTGAIDDELALLASFAPSDAPAAARGRAGEADGGSDWCAEQRGPSSALSLPDAVRSRCHSIVGEAAAGRVVKQLRVARAPRVLFVHLKRVLPTAAGFRKDRTPVVFRPVMSLAPVVERYGDAGSGKGRRRPLYSLVAMVEHLGDAYSGHYICHARQAAQGTGPGDLDERWRMYSDAESRDVTLREVLCREAYILVYDRVDG